MIVPDANVLLFAYNASAVEHARARDWWEAALSSGESVCLSWQTLTAFIRIGTNPRAFAKPMSVAEAVDAVNAWLAQPNVSLVTPGEGHWGIFSRLVRASQASGPLVMDAHLAALTIEHGATLCSHDRDFARFDDLKFLDPIADTRAQR